MNKTANAPVAEAANGVKKDDRLARFIEKVTADQESINLFYDGKITRDELHVRGVRFIKKAYDYKFKFRGGDEEYYFLTESGIRYSCYFTNASRYFEEYPLIKNDIVTFGLMRTRQSKGFFVDKYDARIKTTIFHILRQAIEAYPERSIFVMYDTSDGRQRSRKITFARWYTECCKLINKKVTRIAISGLNMWSGDRFDMMMLVPNTCSKLAQVKLTAFEIRDDLISKGYPPSLECRIECK